MNCAARSLGTSCSFYDKRNNLFLYLHDALGRAERGPFSQGGIFRLEFS
ncbi:Uncharacterised protein [uncultured archaeon]|nr:Uncharacterised protein [uncultured archaeon]